MKNVRVMSADTLNKQRNNYTEKQWLVYYYLMSICKWNGKDNERHYFIYKNALNISVAAKKLGISRGTFHSAFTKLKNEETVIELDNYYIIRIPHIYASVDQKTLSYLLMYQKYLGVDLVRVYAVLNRIFQHKELEQWFTKATLLSILNHNLKDSSQFIQMELYLGFLERWHLIDLKIEKRATPIGIHKCYQVSNIHAITEFEDYEAEMSAPINEELVEQIKKEILENR